MNCEWSGVVEEGGQVQPCGVVFLRGEFYNAERRRYYRRDLKGKVVEICGKHEMEMARELRRIQGERVWWYRYKE